MKYGLSDDDFSFLTVNLISPLKEMGASVYLFGSRATGRYKKFSDIDILFDFPHPSEEFTQKSYLLLEPIEISNFPYKVDLVDAASLVESYKNNILKEKITL